MLTCIGILIGFFLCFCFFFFSFKVFINVPWWYLAFYTMISPFLTQRTKSKFVFAGPAKSPETLFKLVDNFTINFANFLVAVLILGPFGADASILNENRYISPEQVPIQYGGLSVDYCDCNPEFSISDPVTEVNIKPGTKQTVEIIIYEVRYITLSSIAINLRLLYTLN